MKHLSALGSPKFSPHPSVRQTRRCRHRSLNVSGQDRATRHSRRGQASLPARSWCRHRRERHLSGGRKAIDTVPARAGPVPAPQGHSPHNGSPKELRNALQARPAGTPICAFCGWKGLRIRAFQPIALVPHSLAVQFQSCGGQDRQQKQSITKIYILQNRIYQMSCRCPAVIEMRFLIGFDEEVSGVRAGFSIYADIWCRSVQCRKSLP